MTKRHNEPPKTPEVSPTTVQSLLSISREIEDICKRGSDAFAAQSTPVLEEKTILDQIDEFDRLAKKLKEPIH